jgi:hypothetical protein
MAKLRDALRNQVFTFTGILLCSSTSALIFPTIKSSVCECLSEMTLPDSLLFLQVGQGAGHLENALKGPRRQGHLLRRVLEKFAAFSFRLAVPPDAGVVQLCIRNPCPVQLAFPCSDYAFSHCRAVLRFTARFSVAKAARPRHFHMQVDAVQQGAGYLSPVSLNLV